MKSQAADLKAKKSPRQARARVTVEALLEATTRIVEQGGYEALTTNRVAEVAGVSIGSVYEYFPNKQALLAAVAGRTLSAIVDEIDAGLEQALTTSEPSEALRRWFSVMFDAVERRRSVLQVVRHQTPFLAGIPESRRFNRRMLDIASTGFTQSEQQGRMARRFADPEASELVLTTMVGAVVERAAFRNSPLSRERVLRALTEMVVMLLYPAATEKS